MGMWYNSFIARSGMRVVIFVVTIIACGVVRVLMVVRRPESATDKGLTNFPHIGTKSPQELQHHRIGLR
jgi:hypothetical protein